MDSKNIYRLHYVYMIENRHTQKYYIGVRSCTNKLPTEDLGFSYFSTAANKEFIQDQKQNPSHYRYYVLDVFSTRKEAASFEIELHNRFDVAINESFYNRAKATSTSFTIEGTKLSDEHRVKIAKAHVGFRHSEESKEKMKISNIRTPSDETRAKMSAARKGKKRSPESIAKMVETRKKNGYTHSEETKKKISEVKTGRRLTPEHRAKIGRSGEDHPMYGKRGEDSPLYGKSRPDWVKQKISESHIKRNKK